MASWNQALKEGLWVGSVASVLSSLALAAMGRRETGHAAAPTNAISHWLWRSESFRANQPDLRHTLTGYLIHHASSVLWATLYSRAYGQRPGAKTTAQALPASAVASALACFVDYQLSPKRLQPGFEKRLSTPAMIAVYGSFAIGLAAGNLLLASQDRQAQSGERGERRHASDRRQRPRRSNEIAPDRRRWRAGQPAAMGEGAQAWPWPEGSGGGSGSGSGDGGTGESWSATVTSR